MSKVMMHPASYENARQAVDRACVTINEVNKALQDVTGMSVETESHSGEMNYTVMEAQQNLVDVLTQAANGKMVTIEKSDEEIFHLRYIAFLLGNEYD